jgi:PhnB protein
VSDPLDQLRLGDEPVQPDRRFVAGLRARIAAALDVRDAADVPTITLPERSTTVSETTTTPTVTVAITPRLCVNDGVAALAWYADVLGAVEVVRYTADDGRIGHAEMSIGGATFMLNDEYPDFDVVSPTTLGGAGFSMHVVVPDVDAVHARVVASGTVVERPPSDEAYGARSFTMRDPFGHRWNIQTPIGTPSIEEIESGMPGYTVTATPPVEVGDVTPAQGEG